MLLTLISTPLAYNNGMARKPPLGWQTWCSAGPCGTDHCFDYQIKETAQAMVDSGMQKLGYEWVVLDDCWHPTRASNGTLVPHADFFPDGMTPVVDFVHGLGLKFGLYTSVGTRTCHGGWSPGSYGYYEEDAQLFASWGVDWVKMDYCGGHDSPEGHQNFSRAMNATGRPMVLELCRGPYETEPGWGYAPQIAQVWRATDDHHDEFKSTLQQVAAMSANPAASGPSGWAYGDMMMTGGQGCPGYDPHTPQHCPGQSDAEYRTETSLYAVLSSPMMIGTDIRLLTPIMKQLIFNEEMLAINQDAAAPPGQKVSMAGADAWVRTLTDGRVAIALPNLGTQDTPMTVLLDAAGITGGAGAALRDVWNKADLGVHTANYTSTVAMHDTLLLIATPQKAKVASA